MKRLASLSFALILGVSLMAQTQYDNVAKVLSQLDAVMMTKDNNARSKLKQIEFDDYGYSIESYFKLGTLEPGNPVFISQLSDRKLLLVGKVTKSDKAIVVNGVKFQNDGTMLYGIFQVTNTEDGSISYKPRKAGMLEISDVDLNFVSGSDCGRPIILDFKNSSIYIDGKTAGSGWLSLSAHIKNPSTFDYDQTLLRSTTMTMGANVEIEYSDRIFNGNVKTAQVDGKPIAITPLEGYSTCKDGRTLTLKVGDRNLEMTVAKDGAKDRKLSVPLSDITEQEWWNLARIEELYAQNNAKKEPAKKAQETGKKEPAGKQTQGTQVASGESGQSEQADTSNELSTILIAAIAAAAILIIVAIVVALKKRGTKHDVDKHE